MGYVRPNLARIQDGVRWIPTVAPRAPRNFFSAYLYEAIKLGEVRQLFSKRMQIRFFARKYNGLLLRRGLIR
ncbi:MAG: hypothetical protein ACJASL_003886 [Paraglaciecola sp.]